MRRIFIIVAAMAVVVPIALSLGGCKEKKNQKWDPNAMVSLRPAAGVPMGKAGTADAEGHFTALEIVKQCTQLNFYSPLYNQYTGRGFNEVQRDIANVRLMMWGTDVIDMQGELSESFITAQDVVFTISNGVAITDTLAYIPNALLRQAEKTIRAAYAEGDFETVYRVFDETYRFNPITGAEWRALKAQGKQ